MKEAKKILGYINSTYKQEVNVFESMGKVDRKRYASYVLRKKVGFLSPSEWLEKKENAGMTFKEIAKVLNISVLEVRTIYEEAMAKMKAIIENGNIKQIGDAKEIC
uniref:sigma factor-like helix-turn-helix DNA-binding protein n=1 Tax=uncultured Helicobacter sp. TaxID=175537 RepID=UPI00261461C7